MLREPKNPNQNLVLGAKFSHGHVFEALDPLSPSLKQPSLLKTASSQGCCAGYC